MTRSIRLLVVSAMSLLSLGVTACGDGAKLGGGKQGAAQAAFRSSQAPGRGHTQSGQALVQRMLAQGAIPGLSVSANCAHGGSVSMAFELASNPLDAAVHYSVSYDECNEDGVNEYDGTLKMAMGVSTDADYTNFGFFITEKGTLSIDGDITDTLDMDVTLTMDVGATSARAGSVKLVFDGTIKTSSESYTFAKETVTFTAGELPKA